MAPSKPRFSLDYGLLLALVLPLFALMPLLAHSGLPNTADGPAHLMRQVELNQAWQEGTFYPRWGRDLAFGHGMPIFSYAPPALYQLTQLFHLTGLPLDEAMKAVLIFDFLLYSLGMFLLARRLFGVGPALLAATLYVYAPYRLREAYIQGNYGQFTGLAFYPLILWAFHGLVTTRRPGYLVAAVVTLAGLLFSHNISFMLFAPMLAAYLLFLLILTTYQESRSRGDEANDRPAFSNPRTPPQALHLSLIAAASLLGLGLAAIFWLPAFGERQAIQLEGITQGFFDFRENFISLAEFFSLPLPLDLAAINPKFPLSLGLPQIIGAGSGLLALVWAISSLNKQRVSESASQRKNFSAFSLQPSFAQALFFAFFLLLYTFLALPQSQFVWEAVPLLELAEFPWRMLGPALCCASLVAAFGFWILDFRFSIFQLSVRRFNSPFMSSLFHLPFSNFYFLIFVFFTLALNAYYLYPTQFITWGTPTPADAFAYEISSGAIGTTSAGEFLPHSARQHPRPETLWPDYVAGRPPQKIDPATLPSGATVEITARRAESDTFRLNTPTAFTATVRTLYWPGWQVYLNDRPVAFTITELTGLMQVVIPAGEHNLTLKLESTPLRAAGQWLTGLSAVVVAVIAGVALKRRNGESANQRVSESVRPISAGVGATSTISPQFLALAMGFLVVGYLLSRPLAPFFTLQSNPDQPQPAEQVLQVDFGTGQTSLLRLVGLDNLPQTLQTDPNSPTELTPTLYWRALQDLDSNYAVFLHLDAPNGQTWATADEAHPENIPTRNWPPGLYLRNPLRLEIPAHLPPIRYELNTGWYEPQTGQRLSVLPGETTSFNLGSVWLAPPQPDVPAQPQARFGQHITLWQSVYQAAEAQTLTLYWQTDQPLDRADTIFIHLLDATGELIAQADGVPYNGLYPLTHWLPGQVITDTRPLPNSAAPALIAIGIYNPTTGERLPVRDASGQPLPDNMFILKVQP